MESKKAIAVILAKKKMGKMPSPGNSPMDGGLHSLAPNIHIHLPGSSPMGNSGMHSSDLPINPSLNVLPPSPIGENPQQVELNKIPNLNKVPSNPERSAGIQKIGKFSRIFKK